MPVEVGLTRRGGSNLIRISNCNLPQNVVINKAEWKKRIHVLNPKNEGAKGS